MELSDLGETWVVGSGACAWPGCTGLGAQGAHWLLNLEFVGRGGRAGKQLVCWSKEAGAEPLAACPGFPAGRGLPRVPEHPPVHVAEQRRARRVWAVRRPGPFGLQLPRRALLLLREGRCPLTGGGGGCTPGTLGAGLPGTEAALQHACLGSGRVLRQCSGPAWPQRGVAALRPSRGVSGAAEALA